LHAVGAPVQSLPSPSRGAQVRRPSALVAVVEQYVSGVQPSSPVHAVTHAAPSTIALAAQTCSRVAQSVRLSFERSLHTSE
jgi:hypothetical protein